MNIGDVITHNWCKYKIIEFQDKYIEGFGEYTIVLMQNIEDKDKFLYVNKDMLNDK